MVRNSAGGVRKGLYLVTERADRGGAFSLTYYELLTCQKKRKKPPKSGQVISDNREVVKVVCPGPGEALPVWERNSLLPP